MKIIFIFSMLVSFSVFAVETPKDVRYLNGIFENLGVEFEGDTGRISDEDQRFLELVSSV